MSNFENLNTFVSPEKNYLSKFNQILGIKANTPLNKLISKVTPIRNLTIDRVYDNKFLMFEFEYLINSANFPQSCFDSFCKIRNFYFEIHETNFANSGFERLFANFIRPINIAKQRILKKKKII